MTRLPSLGSRGEGWFAIQVVLLGAIALAGLAGPTWDGIARVAALALGSAFVLGGGSLALLGIRDLGAALTPLPHPREGATLVESGIYGRVRHPIYGGLLLGGLGWGLVTASILALVLVVALFAFFSAKARREEAWLITRFPAYPAYRLRTRMFIPFVA